jgi:F420H(2)-dependent biliverdin reductase
VLRLTPEQVVFVTERHLATLTTLRSDGSPHVVPVGFTWDAELGLLRITTREGSMKVRNVERRLAAGEVPRAAVCQVQGGRWLTLEGEITVSRERDEVVEALRRYAARYRTLAEDPRRIVLRVRVDRAMGSDYMTR